MPKKARLPQSSHHVMIYDEVWEYYTARFGDRGLNPIGVSTIIREVTYRHYLKCKEAENQVIDAENHERRRPNAPATNL